MPSFDSVLNAFVTLFVTIDPVGNAPLFLGLTAGMAAPERRMIAMRGVIVAFFILSLFALTGTAILDAMGITINAFRVAGGLLLFVTAFEMIYGQRQERKAQTSESALKDQLADIAVFPLGIPLIAGPGAISATILLSSQMATGSDPSRWIGTILLIGVIFVLLAGTGLVLIGAEFVDKYIGNTARMVLTRLLGVLLAALCVQYVADGALALFTK
ncbi:MAG: MarC family protein [Chloroflexota bacterium]